MDLLERKLTVLRQQKQLLLQEIADNKELGLKVSCCDDFFYFTAADFLICCVLLFTDRINESGNNLLCPSICLSVCFHSNF